MNFNNQDYNTNIRSEVRDIAQKIYDICNIFTNNNPIVTNRTPEQFYQ